MINSTNIRLDFPILNQSDKPLVYFDNACMSLRPQLVLNAISKYYTSWSSCAGRSNHHLAKNVSTEVETSRKKVAHFLKAKRPEEIIFTRNTSEGLNLLAYSLSLTAGDVVVISDKEHNSNLVPWLRLKMEKKIVLRVVPSTVTNEADIEQWKNAIDERVKIVSLVYTSNLDGVTNPVKEIISLAHAVGAITIVDAAQAAPHQPIDVHDLDVDFLVFSVHKLCGPSGMGILYGKLHLLEALQPFMVGGDTVAFSTYSSYKMLSSPEKFEAGLQDYAGIIGTAAALDYISQIGLGNIKMHEFTLNQFATKQLSLFDRIHIIGPQDAQKRGGVLAFTIDGADHHQLALMLDQVGNIMVRSGQHCVHSWFDAQHIPGSVRASFYFYNTIDEVSYFSETLEKILKVI